MDFCAGGNGPCQTADKLKGIAEPPPQFPTKVSLMPKIEMWVLNISGNFCVHYHNKLQKILKYTFKCVREISVLPKLLDKHISGKLRQAHRIFLD